MLIDPLNTNVKKIDEINFQLLCDRFTEEKPDVINKYAEGVISEETLENELKYFLSKHKVDFEHIKTMKNILFGYGILDEYINDPEITDILVNNPQTVFIKKFGEKIKVPVIFSSEDELYKYCYKIVSMNGGIINQNQAQVVVTDRKRHLRIVVSLPPISVGSPNISIRKPAASQSLDMLEKAGMFDVFTKQKLKKYVRDSKTIIIAGKGGSGKTTLLGALINEVPLNQRCILIQETMEIMPKHPDIIVQLVRISDNPEIKNYTLFDLTKHALLMSLDRIFIGEMKDREAFDFFNAVYTGHRGSMATIHANSAGEVVNRLLQLMSRADVDLKEDTLRDMLYSSLDVVIFLENFKIKEIMEINKG